MDSKLFGKNKLVYGRPFTKTALLQILLSFVLNLKRNGTCFFGSCDKTIPLGLALRTPTYLTTMMCIDKLLEHGHIELATEQNSKRVLIKGLPSCFEVSETLASIIDQAGSA